MLAQFFDIPANTNTAPILRGRVAGTADPLSLDTNKATLTRRASESGTVVPLRSGDWALGDCSTVPFPGKPDGRKLCLKDGFNPAYLYELVYTAKDPKVHGIGFAATRDIHSYLRYGAQDDTSVANPLRGRISYTVGHGDSQSGNFIRSFIHLGFNQDESGRKVFDGAKSEHCCATASDELSLCSSRQAPRLFTSPEATALSGGRLTPMRPEIARLLGCSIAVAQPKRVQR